VASVPYQLRSATSRQPDGQLPSPIQPAGLMTELPGKDSKLSRRPGEPAIDPAAKAAGAAAARRDTAADSATGGTAARPDGSAPLLRKLPVLRRLTAGRDALHAEELQAEVSQARCKPIGEIQDREMADVAGTLRTVTLRPRGPSLTMEADLWDGSGNITLIWLGRRDIPGIRPGRSIEVRGRVSRIKGEMTIYNPDYELRSTGGD
jgi:hypothetical protein